MRGLRFAYPMASEHVQALAGVDLDLQRGELVCLTGASGSGKSTLLNCIAGLELPDEGTVLVDGTDVARLGEDERTRLRLMTIGMVFQDHNLIAQFTASENIQVILRCQGAESPGEEAQHLLELVGVRELADRLPTEMSGGQRQRLGIARALAGGRPYLLCDEPTGSLDSANSTALFQRLRHLTREEGVGCLVATHDPLAHEHADRVVHMQDGVLS